MIDDKSVVLGVCSERNCSAALMIGGEVVGVIQEERLSKRKNQIGFPKKAIDRLIATHLGGDFGRVDRVAWAGQVSDPLYCAVDHYSQMDVLDHVQEMHELWYPHFYGDKPNDGAYWVEKYREIKGEDNSHNFDFSFLEGMSYQEAFDHFNSTERTNTLRRLYNYDGPIEVYDHHLCHGYYALYGETVPDRRFEDVLVLTADSWGDGRNWTVSTVDEDGSLKTLDSGGQHTVARIYKFVTLILGMKPNEHEYKVMGLSSYSRSRKHIDAAKEVFTKALQFKDGEFHSDQPLKDSYFDLKDRLEGHRFDNIAAAVQEWSAEVTADWALHWLEKTGRTALCFSGGLSMNIKANADLAALAPVSHLSVPASGGDESISIGACFVDAVIGTPGNSSTSLSHAYLGDHADAYEEDWTSRLTETDLGPSDFRVIEGVDRTAAAKLLANDLILARCDGRSEFGARALGNRSILANPSNPANIKIINDQIKNRDFWMPFTPSILEEHANDYLINPKSLVSRFMTIGFESKPEMRGAIIGGLHMADFSARPQFVSRDLNPEYWSLINAFYSLTGVPALVNTSLNLHGDPMNYSVADAARTLALSGLEYLLLPNDRLLCKAGSVERAEQILA